MFENSTLVYFIKTFHNHSKLTSFFNAQESLVTSDLAKNYSEGSLIILGTNNTAANTAATNTAATNNTVANTAATNIANTGGGFAATPEAAASVATPTKQIETAPLAAAQVFPTEVAANITGNTAANNTGDENTALGYQTLYSNTSGADNTASGFKALYSNTSGSNNTASGFQALQQNTTGSYNTASGYQALFYTTGNYNTANGYEAGHQNTTGTNNTFIGYGAAGSSATASNEITLGNSAITSLRANASITSLSDRRDKTDITTISEGLDFLKQLKPVSFTWNTRDKAKVGIKSAGFIAQDLLALQQKSTIGANLDLVSQENPDKLEARYSNLLPVIIKAIQEESAQKDAEIAALKAVLTQALQDQQKAIQAQ